VLLRPDTSVWGLRRASLPASVAESVTRPHVRGYRGFVRFPLWHSLEISDCWGPLCSRVVDARVWVWQISDVTFYRGVFAHALVVFCGWIPDLLLPDPPLALNLPLSVNSHTQMMSNLDATVRCTQRDQ
jgi:hypothetical protein